MVSPFFMRTALPLPPGMRTVSAAGGASAGATAVARTPWCVDAARRQRRAGCARTTCCVLPATQLGSRGSSCHRTARAPDQLQARARAPARRQADDALLRCCTRGALLAAPALCARPLVHGAHRSPVHTLASGTFCRESTTVLAGTRRKAGWQVEVAVKCLHFVIAGWATKYTPALRPARSLAVEGSVLRRAIVGSLRNAHRLASQPASESLQSPPQQAAP